MSNTAVAEFSGLLFSIHDLDGQRWITATDVGKALGYAQPENVMKVYRNHADEFTAKDTRPSVLEGQGQRREVHLFSATGCVLLSMFANTARAKDFRAWAKRVLAGDATLAPLPERLDRIESSLVSMSSHMAELVQVSHQQAQKLDVTGRYIALLELNQRGKIRVTPEVEAEVFKLKNEGMSQADIARLLRISTTTVCQLLKGNFPRNAALAGHTPPATQQALERLIEKERGALLGGTTGGAA